MKKSSCLALILFLAVSSLAVPSMVTADQVIGIRETVVKRLQKIQALLDAEQYSEAIELIDAVKASKLRDYEKAQVLNLEGYVHFGSGDTLRAREAFAEILSISGIPLGLRQTVVKSLVQLYLLEGMYQKGLDAVAELIAIAKQPEPGHRVLKAQALYHLGRYRDALQAVDTALAMEASAELPPRENWLLMKNAILFELERYEEMVKVVNTLVLLYPKDRYITNLASLYAQIDRADAQLALLEPLYEQGRLTKPEYLVNLANLYLYLGTPYKGAKLLNDTIASGAIEKNFKHLQLQAKAWQLAEEREKAIASYTQAHELADNGNQMVSAAYLHIAAMEWEAAGDALQRAFDKGELDSPGNAHLLLGMVRFNKKEFRRARRAFIAAAEDEAMQGHAEQWLKYLDAEVKKYDTLREHAEANKRRSSNLNHLNRQANRHSNQQPDRHSNQQSSHNPSNEANVVSSR